MKVTSRNREMCFQFPPERAEPYGDGFEAKHSPAGCRESVGSVPWAGCLPGWEQPLHPWSANECWLAMNFLSSLFF